MDEACARIELRFDRTAFGPGDPVWTQAVLRNAGTAPLFVNKRLLLNAPSAPEPFRELELSVVAPDGRRLPFLCLVLAGRPRREDYALLASGEEIGVRFELAEYYDFAGEGTYRVQAFYSDGTAEPPSVPAGATHLRGPIVSDEVPLRIVTAAPA